ncbi:hypothetical protein TRICI_002040 [Trichomonascus ciferrii]|uniref:PH domain-containing protein n=1 Tax=Trichomonascus ciferrii TaxID=44093 RepID=A0A642V6W4_9ASCO|nr:hypothetical protein TRICI_002040 [Trichomonascus ciferrii]
MVDPFFVKDKDGEEVRREAPAGITKEEKKIWKHIIRKAWVHDKSFLGGTYWLDIGLGSAPLVSLIPIIGPITMYVLHGRLVSLAEELRIPATLHAKMTANITFDFLMSLIPVLGAIFSWMNTCSVRNAALVDTHVRKRAQHLQSQIGEFQVSDRGPNRPVTRPSNPPQFQQGAPARPQPQFQQAQQPAPSKKKRGQANYQETGVL